MPTSMLSFRAARRLVPVTAALLLTAATGACSWHVVTVREPPALAPANWAEPVPDAGSATDDWLRSLADARLLELAARACTGNRELREAAATLDEARAVAKATGAARWPSIGLDVVTARRQAGVDFSRSSSVAEARLGADFELDLWGRLSAAERDAVLQWQAQQARYAGTRLRILGAVASGWFAVLEAVELEALYAQRADSLAATLAVIEDRYRRGLVGSLDVYLARNELEQERGRLLDQAQRADAARRRLEEVLGDYPAAAIAAGPTLPAVPEAFAAGLPADLLTRRPDVRAAWLTLLAGDAAVAAAHRERFPRLVLTADVGRSALQLVELVSEANLVWSLAAGLTQPLFDAGRLAAREAQARARVLALEQQYLRTVYTAFAEVEEALSQARALDARYAAADRAQRNARGARTLAFEQYRGGLVDYPTVLEAQRRAFDAEANVVGLRAAIVQNRVALHLALAGAPLAD